MCLDFWRHLKHGTVLSVETCTHTHTESRHESVWSRSIVLEAWEASLNTKTIKNHFVAFLVSGSVDLCPLHSFLQNGASSPAAAIPANYVLLFSLCDIKLFTCDGITLKSLEPTESEILLSLRLSFLHSFNCVSAFSRLPRCSRCSQELSALPSPSDH